MKWQQYFIFGEGLYYLYLTQINVEWELEINVKAVLVYFNGDVGRTKNTAVVYNVKKTNQYSFTRCFSFFMSRVLPVLATLMMQYAKEHRSMILFLLRVCDRTSGEFGSMRVQYVKKCMKSGYFARLYKTESGLDHF